MVKQLMKLDLAQMEKNVLNDVMSNSKEILEVFKYNTIYSMKITTSVKKKTVQGLKEFRAQNVLNDAEYKKYLNLY